MNDLHNVAITDIVCMINDMLANIQVSGG